MGVDAIGPRGGGDMRVRANRASDTRFTVDAEPASLAPITAATIPAGLLALQEAEGEPPRDRAARRHGRALLQALAHLQRDLLADADPETALRQLAELAAHVPVATDPALNAAIDAALLRAKVELARREA